MEWEIGKSEETGFVRIALTGRFRTENFPQLFKEIVSAETWFPGTPILFDNRELDLKDVNHRQIERLSSYFEGYNLRFGSGKIALLKKTQAGFGIGRQFQLMTEEKVSAQVRVFLNEMEAVKWLSS